MFQNKYLKYKQKYINYKINIRKSYLQYKIELIGGNYVEPEEEINFIYKKCVKNKKCTKKNIEKVLDFYYNELAIIEPNPELSYDIMARKTGLPLKLIKIIWKYQLEFLIEKGIAHKP